MFIITIFSTYYNGTIIFQPTKKIKKAYYKCDNKFHLDEILEMYKTENLHGVVYISGEKYEIHKISISGNHIDSTLLLNKNVHLKGETKAGGQSAQRFDRTRENDRNTYVKSVSESIVNKFMVNNCSECIIESLILCGPAENKKKLLNLNNINKYFGKITKIVTCNYQNPIKIYTENKPDNKEYKIKQYIDNLIIKNSDRLIFGYKNIINELKNCMLEKIIISNDNNILDEIYKLNTYNCKITLTHAYILNKYDNIIGVKWY